MASEDRHDRPSRIGGLGGTRKLAYGAILVERVWPLVLALACLVAVFFILSWFGIFAAIPFPARAGVLLVLAAAAVWALWRNRGFRPPSRVDVDRRIETVSRLQHQPLRSQGDRATSTDPFAAALWHEHQRRMAEQLANLGSGSPNTRSERLDPFGLRALVALLLVTAFAFSFGPGGGRVLDAFTPAEAETIASARVDAWVTPPTYTGQAPIFLTDLADASDGAAIAVPEGSLLSVRISDATQADLTFTPQGEEAITVPPVGSEPKADGSDGTDKARPEESAAPGVAASGAAGEGSVTPTVDGAVASAPKPGEAGEATGPLEFSYELARSGEARLSTTFSTLGDWRFDVTPDAAPQIAFSQPPSEARNGALQLAYSVTDDYGVAHAKAEIVVEDDTVAADARPLVAPPEVKLSLPRRTKGTAEAKTSADLTESPYAGAKVALTLTAEDDAGHVGRSKTETLTLPQKRFSNPLARAVVEQRRLLALNAKAAPRVVDMLDAVTLRGEEFIDDPANYLALRAARTRIATAYDDEALISAVDFMWQIALGIEDGNLSLAERELRDAREQLSEALENGASNQEIDRLMQELREAMNDYMHELAEAMKNQPPMDQNQMGDMQELRPQDLDEMMNRIEDLAKSGSKDAAQQLLSELQQMMDNLQAMRPGQRQQGGEQNAMQQQMDKMGELLQRQQKLMDQTFDLGRRQAQRREQDRRNQQQGQNGQPQQGQQQPGEQGEPQAGSQGEPMTAQQLQEMLKQLQDQQGKLQQELQAMQDAMKGMGMQPGKGLDDAGDAMGKAEGALGQGQDGEAVGQQGRAMEALRQGAKDMMQQMQQAMQQGNGQGKGNRPGRQNQMGQGFGGRQPMQSNRDPLGRQRQTQGPDFGQDVGVPDEIDTQKAREILDAIRKRLGDQLSPELERQYLERLLQTP